MYEDYIAGHEWGWIFMSCWVSGTLLIYSAFLQVQKWRKKDNDPYRDEDNFGRH